MSQAERIAKVREYLKEHNVDALLMSNYERKQTAFTIYYLTGFTGTHGHCILLSDRAVFVTDSRYELQASSEVEHWEIHILAPFFEKFFALLNTLGMKRIGVIAEQISWEDVMNLEKRLTAPVEIVPLSNIIEEIGAIKDIFEVQKIRAAVRAIERALEQTYAKVRPGVTELALNRVLRDALPDGVEFSFPSIIASGTRSAIPHGRASDKAIERGDIVQFDVGCVVDGYASDISRVVVVGKATKKQKAMHRAVVHAIDEAVQFYRPGVATREAHERAQQIITQHGFPEFGHGLGHGMGLDVHESPAVAATLSSTDVFQEGNVVTIEPGIYEEGYGGMRIERDVVITKTGNEYLDTLTTDLLEL